MLKHYILWRLRCNAFIPRTFVLNAESLLHPGILAMICTYLEALTKAASSQQVMGSYLDVRQHITLRSKGGDEQGLVWTKASGVPQTKDE